jgi:streptogramin lyase
LAVNTFGPYQFFLQAPGEASLWIGETEVINGEAGAAEGLGGGLMLARGHHTIRVRAEGGEGRVRLAWQPPDGPPETVPPWALYVSPVQSNGLLGNYYANGNWEGDAAFAQIDPRLSIYFHVPTLPRPYTVEWRGKIAIPASGHYDFALQSIDESTLQIDGIDLTASRTRNAMGTAGLILEAGLHDIVVRYADRTDHTYINLLWRSPGGDAAYHTIPSELLFPPQESYDLVDVGNLARFVQSDTQASAAVVRDQIDPSNIEIVVEGLLQPRGVAVSDGVVYVAETGARRVVAFDSVTGAEVTTPFTVMELAEPFDLAVAEDGAVWLLDAAQGQLLRYDPAAGRVATVRVPQQYTERSRGIGAGVEAEMWLASTAAQRIVAIGPDGAILHEIVMPAVTGDDKEMQPVDVALMKDDTLFVTDVAGHVLYRFGGAGYLISSQPIPVANSLDSAHLATDARGALYMTEPEAGRVVMLDESGAVQRVWSVRNAELRDAKPVGIDVSVDGTVWVADSQGGRLLRLTPVEVVRTQ